MKQSKLIIITILATFTTFGVLSSSSVEAADPGGTPPPRRKVTREAYRAELDALMTEHKVACKISLDCEALPLGVKACGGPTEFIVLSKGTKAKMQDALTDLTKTINEMDTAANQGMMGTCQALEKPEVACSSGSCAKVAAKK